MAELRFPDIAGSFQHGHSFGTRNRLLGESEQRRSRLADLAGQAFNSSGEQRNQLIGQAVGVDPGAGFQLESDLGKSQDGRTEALVRASKLLLSAPEQSRAALYEQMKGDLGRVIPGLPNQYDNTVLEAATAINQAYGGTDKAGQVQSTYIDDRGQRVAILRDGSTQILGNNAPNNQIIDTGNGFFGVNKGNLQAAPVQVGGAPQQAAPQAPQAGMYQTPQGVVRLGDDLSPEQREAAMADVAQGGQASSVTLPERPAASQQVGGGDLLRKAPASITPYQQAQLDMQRERTTAATAAKEEAAAARKVAEDLKTSAKQQESQARQDASAEAANALVMSIDQLTSHPGFAELGTAWGDTKIATPLIRNDAKDADAKLKNVAGQVALATLARLKSLSSTGATGFGSLTKPELDLVQNSIATLQSENISNAELKSSLKVIRDAMEKTATWKPSASAPATPENDDEALFGKYLD